MLHFAFSIILQLWRFVFFPFLTRHTEKISAGVQAEHGYILRMLRGAAVIN